MYNDIKDTWYNKLMESNQKAARGFLIGHFKR